MPKREGLNPCRNCEDRINAIRKTAAALNDDNTQLREELLRCKKELGECREKLEVAQKELHDYHMKLVERRCKICGVDISDRHHSAVYCAIHADYKYHNKGRKYSIDSMGDTRAFR